MNSQYFQHSFLQLFQCCIYHYNDQIERQLYILSFARGIGGLEKKVDCDMEACHYCMLIEE